MSPPFAILNIDHVVLRTADPARLEAFYRDVLGCPVEKRQEAIGLTQLRAGGALIDIVSALSEPPHSHASDSDRVNMDHLCLRIEPFDVEAINRHLDCHGVPRGEVELRYGAEGKGPSIYINDPEGNRVELKGPASE